MIHSLTTFLLATIMALALVPAPQTQRKSPPQREKTGCGTVIPPEQLKAELARGAELTGKNTTRLALAPNMDNPLYLPLTIHMVCDDEGIGGQSSEQLEAVMQNLNQMWQPVGIQFFVYGEVDFSIHDRNFFIMPDDYAKQDALLQINVVPNTINVYFTNLQGAHTGQARFTTHKAQGILLDYLTMSGFGGTFYGLEVFAHEMGHYFDLYHTHETAFGVECPSGNNCSTAGDRLCDTPADPKLDPSRLVDNNCLYINLAATPAPCDNTPYQPSTRNLMSYTPGHCSNEFTPNQIGKVWQVLNSASNRKNLIDSGKFYVDPQASNSNTKCTASAPCRTVAKAVSAAQDGAFIYLKPGVHPVSEISGKKLTLKKWGEGGAAELRP